MKITTVIICSFIIAFTLYFITHRSGTAKIGSSSTFQASKWSEMDEYLSEKRVGDTIFYKLDHEKAKKQLCCNKIYLLKSDGIPREIKEEFKINKNEQFDFIINRNPIMDLFLSDCSQGTWNLMGTRKFKKNVMNLW